MTTVDDVVEALSKRRGEWTRALDLQATRRDPPDGIVGSIQGIGNALRHGHNQGRIERRLADPGRNTSEWRVR